MIKVSIITPSFNQGQFIESTIQSVLNQTYKNIEYIIVDGGSTDNTMEVVRKYQDKIDIVIHEKDKGQADAINKGFRLATGILVGWINSDDILYPECVERIVECYYNNPKGAIYYSSHLDWINEDGNIIAHRTVNIKDRNYLLNINYVLIQQGSFYPRNLIEKINYLDIYNYYCMDLALWLDLSQYGHIHKINIEESLAAFRIYEGTKTDTGKIKFLMNIKKVLLQKGAKWYSPNIRRIYYNSLKCKTKELLCMN